MNDDCFEKEQGLRELVLNLVQTNQLEKLPILAKDIQKATKEDEVLSKVSEYISKRVGLLTKRTFQKNYSDIFRNDSN